MNTSHSGDRGWRIALAVFFLAAIVWLGTTNARAIIGNQLLRPATLSFDDYLAPEAQRELFRLLSITSVVIILSYATALVSGAMFLWLMPYSMKEHGWLMLCAILFFVWIPVEGYTLSLDAQMVYDEFFTTADNQVFRQLFMKRLTALAGAPIIAVLCYYTIVVIAVLQPLRRRAKPAA